MVRLKPIEESNVHESSSALLPFVYREQQLRTILDQGEPWFVVADVAAILGYRDAANAARTVRRRHLRTHSMMTNAGERQMLIVNEPGLYRLMMRSNSPNADEFQDKITDEILPAIRRTGSYGTALDAADRAELESLRTQVRALTAGKPPMWAHWAIRDNTTGQHSGRSLESAVELLSQRYGFECQEEHVAAAIEWFDSHAGSNWKPLSGGEVYQLGPGRPWLSLYAWAVLDREFGRKDFRAGLMVGVTARAATG